MFDVSLSWPATVSDMQRPLALRTVLTLTLVGWSAHAASQAGSTLGISVIPSPHQPSQSKRLGLTELIKREAEQHGLPSELTDAFIATVSRYQATASGRFGEVGLMQIHPAAAKQHGFVGGTMDLYAPEHNIRYGTAHLVRAWSIADHDLCLTLLKYRTNYGEDEVTPAIAAECIEWRTNLEALGSPLAKAPTAAKPHAGNVPLRPAPQPSQAATPRGAPPSPAHPVPLTRPPIGIVGTRAVPDTEGAKRTAGATSHPSASAASAGTRAGSLPAHVMRPPRTPEESRRYWAAHEKRVKEIGAAFRGRVGSILRDQAKR